MRLLLVEDDENKASQLCDFLKTEYAGVAIQWARSLQSGVRSVRESPPDAILLDMTLPNYDVGPEEPGGGSTHSFGGREFLRQLDRFDLEIPVVVVTQFETFGDGTNSMDLHELDEQLREEHGPVYRGAVYYHAAVQGWQQALRALLDPTLETPPSDG